MRPNLPPTPPKKTKTIDPPLCEEFFFTLSHYVMAGDVLSVQSLVAAGGTAHAFPAARDDMGCSLNSLEVVREVYRKP